MVSPVPCKVRTLSLCPTEIFPLSPTSMHPAWPEISVPTASPTLLLSCMHFNMCIKTRRRIHNHYSINTERISPDGAHTGPRVE